MLVGVIPSVIIKTQIIESYERRAVEVKTAEIRNQCTILCSQLGNSNDLASAMSEIIRTELTQLSNIYAGRIVILDEKSEIIADTSEEKEGNENISIDFKKHLLDAEKTQYNDKEKYIEVVLPIKNEEEELLGVLLMHASTDAIAATMDIMWERANVVSWSVIIVVLVVAFVLGSLMVRPFGRITKSIEAVTEGYDDNYLHENAYTETMLISEAFNKMLGRLKVLDDSRQEFVANVSHELKTPLTSMKVLADSLLLQKDVSVELYKEFMGDMSDEIERENKIINDLLALVKMDKTASEITVKQENINDLIERILKRLQPIAMQEHIELVFESFRPVSAQVDETKLSLALMNLIENAIKYNQENGWVHVSLNADHKYFYVEVADSGIGIPKEATEHIFERFYRVDKSHSREIGGTGLGLSIARNAVVMHRGAIKVFSKEGEGTTFTVRIPVTYAG